MFSILTLLWIFGFRGPHPGVLNGMSQIPTKGSLRSASASTDESVPHLFRFFFFFVSIIWKGDMLGCVIMQKIPFSLDTQLLKSKHKHILTDLFFKMYYLFNPPSCVSFFFLKERKSVSQFNWLCYC